VGRLGDESTYFWRRRLVPRLLLGYRLKWDLRTVLSADIALRHIVAYPTLLILISGRSAMRGLQNNLTCPEKP
jgi:hypothetical protein